MQISINEHALIWSLIIWQVVISPLHWSDPKARKKPSDTRKCDVILDWEICLFLYPEDFIINVTFSRSRTSSMLSSNYNLQSSARTKLYEQNRNSSFFPPEKIQYVYRLGHTGGKSRIGHLVSFLDLFLSTIVLHRLID